MNFDCDGGSFPGPYNWQMSAYASLLDRVIIVFDEGLRTCFGPPVPVRKSPGDRIDEPSLTNADREKSIELMRVNHAGEVAAQALYAGQAVFSRADAVRAQLLSAADDEKDHLAWCARRLDELNGNTSLLVPFWYAGSALIGAVASVAGDRSSLGFVQETERQVEAHLDDHLRRLPAADYKSRAILQQMSHDEARHGRDAQIAGAAELPRCVIDLMAIGGRAIRQIAQVL